MPRQCSVMRKSRKFQWKHLLNFKNFHFPSFHHQQHCQHQNSVASHRQLEPSALRQLQFNESHLGEQRTFFGSIKTIWFHSIDAEKFTQSGKFIENYLKNWAMTISNNNQKVIFEFSWCGHIRSICFLHVERVLMSTKFKPVHSIISIAMEHTHEGYFFTLNGLSTWHHAEIQMANEKFKQHIRRCIQE